MQLGRVPMAEPRLEEDEIEAAVRILRSGKLRQGPVVEAFEHAFAELVGVQHACATSSGTAALHVAYQSVLAPGAEVLVPAFTFFATASAVVLAGGVPVFCDVDPLTFNLSLQDAASRITPRTQAVCVVALFGLLPDYVKVRAFAQEHDLALFGDLAQALGAHDGGVTLDRSTLAAAHSFYPSKNLFVGEGGMLTTNDKGVIERARLLRSHGRTAPHEHRILGMNYRMTEVEAAIGLQQIPKVLARSERRQELAACYSRAFSELPGVTVPSPDYGTRHVFHQYTVLLDECVVGPREGVRQALDTHGIETAVHYPKGLHQQPAFCERFQVPHLPHTERLARSVLSLPVHHHLTDAQAERVMASFSRVIHEKVG